MSLVTCRLHFAFKVWNVTLLMYYAGECDTFVTFSSPNLVLQHLHDTNFNLKVVTYFESTRLRRKCLRFFEPKLRWKTYFFSARFIAFELEGQQNPCDLTKDIATSLVHSLLLLSTFFHIILFGRKSTCDGIFAPRQKYVKTKSWYSSLRSYVVAPILLLKSTNGSQPGVNFIHRVYM